MITQVQSAFQRTQSCIQRPSTYRSSIIFSGNKYLNKRSSWSMFLLRNKLLIYSPNHCPGRPLNTSGKSWGLLMHHLIVETLMIDGCTHGSSGVYAYMCWVAAQVQGEHIMHCWHYGGSTEGHHGCWSEYCCNMFLYISWSFMVFGGLWFFFADLVYSQGEHVLRGSITLCP